MKKNTDRFGHPPAPTFLTQRRKKSTGKEVALRSTTDVINNCFLQNPRRKLKIRWEIKRHFAYSCCNTETFQRIIFTIIKIDLEVILNIEKK